MEKDKALEMAVLQIERQYGKGSIMRLGDDSAALQVPAISTGSLALDLALGVGGVPRGRVVEIFGPESSGKTTLALHMIAEAQRAGGKAAFIDAEHAMDSAYARRIGVNIDELLVSQPDNGEQALEITELLIRSGALDIVVIDSVAALTPRAEIEGEMGDSHVGLQARLMSQALRKLAGTISKTQTTAVFINQLREKVGVMFGNPEVTPGGRALKFYASVRLDIRRIETLKEGTEAVGNRVRVRVVKNKVAPPFKEAEFDIMYGTGHLHRGRRARPGASSNKIVQKSGAWFSYGDQRLGQGRENVRQFLRDNPELVAAARGARSCRRSTPSGCGTLSGRPRPSRRTAAGGARAEAPCGECSEDGGRSGSGRRRRHWRVTPTPGERPPPTGRDHARSSRSERPANGWPSTSTGAFAFDLDAQVADRGRAARPGDLTEARRQPARSGGRALSGAGRGLCAFWRLRDRSRREVETRLRRPASSRRSSTRPWTGSSGSAIVDDRALRGGLRRREAARRGGARGASAPSLRHEGVDRADRRRGPGRAGRGSVGRGRGAS